MATISIAYTVGSPGGVVTFTDRGAALEFWGGTSGRDPHENVLVRMIQDEFAQNGTTSGTVTVTAT